MSALESVMFVTNDQTLVERYTRLGKPLGLTVHHVVDLSNMQALIAREASKHVIVDFGVGAALAGLFCNVAKTTSQEVSITVLVDRELDEWDFPYHHVVTERSAEELLTLHS